MNEELRDRLATVEGFGLEALVGQLYEERSRLGLGDFPLSERIQGYWDRGDVEIDLVALNEKERRIRFGTCKRDPEKLLASLDGLQSGANAFLVAHGRFQKWKTEFVAIAPSLSPDLRARLASAGTLAEDIPYLTRGM